MHVFFAKLKFGPLLASKFLKKFFPKNRFLQFNTFMQHLFSKNFKNLILNPLKPQNNLHCCNLMRKSEKFRCYFFLKKMGSVTYIAHG